MKNGNMAMIAVTLVIAILFILPATAADSQNMGDGIGQNAQGDGQQSGDGNRTGVQIQVQEQVQQQQQTQQQLRNCTAGLACNGTELQLMIQERERLYGTGEEPQVQEQNRVRVAVHAFNAAEGLAGPQGQQMVEIANQFNNSLQITVRAEEQIRNRNSFVRFLFGGDAAASDEILQQVNQNRNRIQEMNRLIQECDCDPQVRLLLQEQVRNMEQEQERLQQLAQGENDYKGLFGWIFR